MSSALSWIDFSERERRQVLDVVDLFSDRDTRDELGLGTLRDTIADVLFPGTSTVQTRARYLLFVPWLYLEVEARGPRAAEAVRRHARDLEISLIAALLEGDEGDGVIGRRSQQRLQRLPSSIYWQGLGVWGIRRYPGTPEQYLRAVSTGRPLSGELFGVPADRTTGWRSPPEPPAGLMTRARLALRPEDASFLRDRLLGEPATRSSLLAWIVQSEAAFARDEPAWQLLGRPGLPDDLARWLDDARRLSFVAHGAALLYNLLLSRHFPRADWRELYEERLDEWAGKLAADPAIIAAWDWPALRQRTEQRGGRVPHGAWRFLERWMRLAATGAHASMEAEELVTRRERDLKKGRARLVNPTARQGYTGAAGAAALSFRWPVAASFALDILNPDDAG
jgi:hypothetical protein